MDAHELDRLMRETFGDDYRDKVFVNALGVFPLRDVFDECGLHDPQKPTVVDQARGLWQTLPPEPFDPPSEEGR
jgi:hypothetical protein